MFPTVIAIMPWLAYFLYAFGVGLGGGLGWFIASCAVSKMCARA